MDLFHLAYANNTRFKLARSSAVSCSKNQPHPVRWRSCANAIMSFQVILSNDEWDKITSVPKPYGSKLSKPLLKSVKKADHFTNYI